MAPVHPRSRGEQGPGPHRSRPALGSSPLARGTDYSDPFSDADWRFIPARAGNSDFIIVTRSILTVHPRSRGEQSLRLVFVFFHGGSSPLARGTGPVNFTTPGSSRFIPARAGNRSSEFHNAGQLSVHPRSRGEQRWSGLGKLSRDGSSPLARGTVYFIIWLRGFGRFIPARAGNSQGFTNFRFSLSVHPRSRGEQIKGGRRL